MDIKNSDFILVLRLEDFHGQPMRVADCAELKIRVWTNDPTHFLTFGKRDIISDDYNDRIAIDRMQMECLHSGNVLYDYDYSKWNADFSDTDEKYNKVKTVVTDVYWRNVMNPENPCNVVNYQTIEHVYDLIEKERLEREKLGNYVEKEYTNKLADEVKRSTEVDMQTVKELHELKTASEEKDTDLQTKLDAEIQRSTDVDIATAKLINDNLTSTTEKTEQLTNDLASEINRAKAKENEIAEDLSGEINRAKAKENEIANDLASEIERSKNFDQQIRDAIEQETERAKAKETLVDGKITDEVARAKQVESDITSSLTQLKDVVKEEKQRSADKDTEHTNAINEEAARATAKENEIATNLTTEITRAKAEEKRIEGLIDANTNKDTDVKKALDTLSDNLNTETTRATNAEKQLQTSLTSTDKKVEKNATDIATETTRATAKEAELNKLIADNATADAKTRNDLTSEVSRATGEEQRIEGITATNASNITSEIARAKQVEADITSSLQLLKTTVKTKDDAHDEAINTLNTSLTSEIARSTAKDDATDSRLSVIEGDSKTVGSIAHSLSDAKHYTDEEIVKAKTTVTTGYTDALKSYATKTEVDSRIEAVIGTAPEALDTLGEIAEKLTTDSDAITAINGVLSGKADSDSVYNKNEIDTKVTSITNDLNTEVTRATNAETTIANDLATEVSRAKSKENSIEGNVSLVTADLETEKLRAKNAEADLTTSLNTVTTDVNKLKTTVSGNSDAIAIINGDATVNGSINHALSDAKHYTDDEIAKVKADLNVSVAGFATKNELAETNSVVSTKADKATTYTKSEVDEKIANVDVTEQLASYEKTVDVDKKLAKKANVDDVTTEFAKKLDKTTYATDKTTFAIKTEVNAAIKTVSDNLTSEVTRATAKENEISTEVAKKANSADVYTKSAVDEKLDKKTSIKDENGNVITEMVIDNSSADDSVEVYTKEQCDNRFMKMWAGSQSDYDAITSKDNNTLYVIQ